MQGYVRETPNYVVRQDLGMADAESDAAVHALIVEFIDGANAHAAENHIVRFHDRLAAFQDSEVQTPFGNDYDEFFGHSPPEYFDDDGAIQWDRVR
jgi:hypothetical protein